MSIEQFHNVHAGETMLIVGNGENLKLTPPGWFAYPSIGCNTIHLYENWKPTYYTAVDDRVAKGFGAEIAERFADIPKIVPKRLRYWQERCKTNHFYFFNIRPGVLWSLNDRSTLWQDDISEMTYGNIIHVAIKLALHMGAAKILIIGMEHKPQNGKSHFWGVDGGGVSQTPLPDWFAGYKQLVEGATKHNVQILNISQNTYVPEEIIPRADWCKYVQSAITKE